jgi:hypothetical protein
MHILAVQTSLLLTVPSESAPFRPFLCLFAPELPPGSQPQRIPTRCEEQTVFEAKLSRLGSWS